VYSAVFMLVLQDVLCIFGLRVIVSDITCVLGTGALDFCWFGLRKLACRC